MPDNPRRETGIYVLALTLLASLAAATPAATQQMENGYQFPNRNPSNMAVIMKQVEEGMFDNNDSSGAAVAPSESTVLICGGGGGGDSAATSNDSCVILNETTGQIAMEQASAGDQTAESSETAAASSEDLSDVLEALQ